MHTLQSIDTDSPIVHGVFHLSVIADTIAQITQHATIHTASHSRMVASKLNVRRKQVDHAELKALIRSQGLLQNLIGFRQLLDGVETGIIEIVAGRRRLMSIGELIADGDLPDDYQIPYLLVNEDEAIDLSLAENLGRVDMHPADVFEAMLELTQRGRAIEDIGLAFRLDVLEVKRRLKLANVSPRLLDLYRNDAADFKQMMALAISDDHAAQEQAWDSLGQFNRSHHELRRLLTAQQINIKTDRLALYVGVNVYEKAGGTVTRDLFSDNGTGYVSDVALLERLALAKMEKQRAKLMKEGLGWVEILPRADHAALSEFGRVRTILMELSAEQLACVAALDERLALLEERIEALDAEGDEEACAALAAEQDELTAQRRAIDVARASVPHADDAALAGAVVVIDERGALVVKRDLIRPTDKVKMAVLTGVNGNSVKPRRTKSVHSDRLTHELTSQRTAALQAEMMDQGEVALRYLTYTLMRRVLQTYADGTAAKISLTRPMLADVVKKGAAAQAFDARRQELVERLSTTNDSESWLAWLTGQPQAVVLEMLAFCVASSLDTTQQREGPCADYAVLATALRLDMGKWWKPTAADYFNHVSKEQMMAVLTQAVSAESAVPLEKMKKAAAAEAAERTLAGTVWLPPALCNA
ncbi:ParB/RepB/Spo0J family partition protein [Janthinobacterium sp. HLX7-2]|uniref:ParB/RepB/Spo0J family partition protein n=1 Tax=Janthinobacterium sp. HLX7-2 TaxID=1259331 RepID=UPI003F21FDDF